MAVIVNWVSFNRDLGLLSRGFRLIQGRLRADPYHKNYRLFLYIEGTSSGCPCSRGPTVLKAIS